MLPECTFQLDWSLWWVCILMLYLVRSCMTSIFHDLASPWTLGFRCTLFFVHDSCMANLSWSLALGMVLGSCMGRWDSMALACMVGSRIPHGSGITMDARMDAMLSFADGQSLYWSAGLG